MDPSLISQLKPAAFFQLTLDCKKLPPKATKGESPFKLSDNTFEKYKFPLTNAFTLDRPFADVAIGWDNEGIEAYVKVDAPFIKASYPQVTTGDSVELFVDTRDIKTSGYNTKFCHHFFFLPELFEGKQAGELTRFRTEDAHELCESSELKVHAVLKKNSYSLQIFIPVSCLHGYDPDQYPRLGFTYRINHGGNSQHFSVVSSEYQLEQQPSLWSSLKLSK